MLDLTFKCNFLVKNFFWAKIVVSFSWSIIFLTVLPLEYIATDYYNRVSRDAQMLGQKLAYLHNNPVEVDFIDKRLGIHLQPCQRLCRQDRFA